MARGVEAAQRVLVATIAAERDDVDALAPQALEAGSANVLQVHASGFAHGARGHAAVRPTAPLQAGGGIAVIDDGIVYKISFTSTLITKY